MNFKEMFQNAENTIIAQKEEKIYNRTLGLLQYRENQVRDLNRIQSGIDCTDKELESIKNGDPEIIEKLLNNTSLHTAADLGAVDYTKVLYNVR